jgi:hypothetical protein
MTAMQVLGPVQKRLGPVETQAAKDAEAVVELFGGERLPGI